MRHLGWDWRGLFFVLAVMCKSGDLYAISTVPLDGILGNLPALLKEDTANVIVKTFGLVFDHRPMEPATPLGTKFGLDLGIEVNLIQIPTSFGDTLAEQGINPPSIPILPSLKMLNLHKGLGDSVDIGGSILSYQGYLIWAVEMKVVLFNPEEGATWAMRLSRNSLHIPVGNASMGPASVDVSFDAITWTPELVVSRKLDFADPYIGVGYQYTTGGINISVTPSELNFAGLDSVSGKGGGLLAFLGISLIPPNVGLRLTLEGAYSSAGYNSMGTKIGFSF